MRSLPFLIVLVAVSWSTSGAWAQFGLYGAPEALRLPQSGTDLLPYQNYPSTNTTVYAVPATRVVAEPNPLRSTGAIPASATTTPFQVAPGRQTAENRWLNPTSAVARPAVRRVSMVDQMLQKADCGVADDCGATASCGATADCGVESCLPAPCCPWFASASWLILGRDKPNYLWTSYESGNEPNQLRHPWGMEWTNGGEIQFGRRFCCDQWGLELSYWTIDPMHSFSSITNASGVSTTLRVSEIEFAGVNGVDLFDNAAEHRLWRRNEFHNVELNLIRYTMPSCCGGPWDFSCSAGVRFFRFEENLKFGSLEGGCSWGQDGGIHEAYLDDNIENNLLGVQFGCDARYNCWGNLGFFLSPKFGIYNNRIEHKFQAYRGDGTVANPTAASGVTDSYPVESSTDVFSFLTEVDVGLDWQISANWSARVGYRVVAVTGVGLADNQIPTYVVDIPEIRDIDHNGNLLLHGAFAGVTYNY